VYLFLDAALIDRLKQVKDRNRVVKYSFLFEEMRMDV
jgi:hypothetical protein